MASTHTVGWDLDPNPDRPSAQSDDVVAAGARVMNVGIARVHASVSRTHAFVVNPVAGLGGVVVTQAPEAGGDVLVSWRAIELLYESTDDEVTVEARLVDGDSNPLYWDGAAWSAAGAGDWNSPDDVEANFASLLPSDTRLVGVEWRVSSSADAETSPRIYGAVVLGDVRFSWRSGTDGRSDSWLDDLVHNVVLRTLRDLRPEVSDETVTSATLAVLDYSSGLPDRSGHAVADVTAVYDLTSDPDLEVEVSGTWDSGAKTWTPDVAFAPGTRILARVQLAPAVEFSADDETFIKSLPAYVLEGFSSDEDRFTHAEVVVRNRSAGTAEVVGVPAVVNATMRCRAESDDVAVALAMVDAAKDLFATGEIVAKSSATGQLFTITATFGVNSTPGTEAVRGTVSFQLRVRTTVWYGLATSRSLVASGGFEPTVSVSTEVIPT